MTQYLPYIFGTVSFLGGFYIFLLSFKIYKPKQKTQEQKERMEKWHQKFGTLMKVLSIILILNGAYDLIARDPERYNIGKSNKNRDWTTEDREELIRRCMRDAQATTKQYPQITKEYCECSMDNIMQALTFEEYVKTLEMPMEERAKKVIPIFQDCIDELKSRIDEEKNKQNDC